MTHETPALFAQSASALTPFLSVQTYLCSLLESRYASSLPLDNIYPNGLFHKSFPNFVLSCGPTTKHGARVSIPLADRRCMHRREAGHKKRRRRPYSATAHDDQEGSGPTSAAARHKCRARQLFQLRTGTAQFIRQEGGPVWRLSFSGF
jgi:hypothetical protein